MKLLNIFRKKNSISDPLDDVFLLKSTNAEILSDGRTSLEIADTHRAIVKIDDDFVVLDGPFKRNVTKETCPSIITHNDNFYCQCVFVDLGLHRLNSATPFIQMEDPLISESIAVSFHWVVSYKLHIEQYIRLFNFSQVRLEDVEANISITINGYIRKILGELIAEAQIPILQINQYMDILQKCIELSFRIELYEKYGLYITSLLIDKVNYNQNKAYYSLQTKMQERENALYETKRQREEDDYQTRRQREKNMQDLHMKALYNKLDLLREKIELELIKDNTDAYTLKRELDIKEAEAKKSINIDCSRTTNVYRTRNVHY